MTRSTLTVELGAVRANAQRLVALAGHSRLWAVVKADGYGHGAAACAGAALSAGAERICCATLGEARELRDALGEAVAIVVLSPLEPGEEVAAPGFEIVVSSLADYARLRAAGIACDVHVKADTGMGRWGMSARDALATGRELAAAGGPLIEHEWDFNVEWKPKWKPLPGLWLRARYGFSDTNQNNIRTTVDEVRLILNYTLSIY